MPEVSQIPANPESTNLIPPDLRPQELAAECKGVPIQTTHPVHGNNEYRDGRSGLQELDSSAMHSDVQAQLQELGPSYESLTLTPFEDERMGEHITA